jgi:fatty acid desaturase
MLQRWAGWVVLEWILIAIAMWGAWNLPWYFLPVAALVIGTRQQALGVLGHEAVHRTLGESKAIDTAANWLCFYPIGVDLETFRSFHAKHHSYLGTDQDPELEEHAKFPAAWSDLTTSKKLKLVLRDLVGLGIPEALSNAETFRGEYTPARAIATLILLFVCVITGFLPLLILWVWSLLTVNMAAMRARMYTEHIGMPPGETWEWEPKWWQRALYVPHYIWKHNEHHANPSTPCWYL